MMNTYKVNARNAFALSLVLCGGLLGGLTSAAQAGVVMVGTRVIYHPEHKEETLQFRNESEIPYLIQVWLDKGDSKSSPQTADAPFFANPQVFRMNPHVGQMVRLMYTGVDDLPKDRESVFYLNFSQTPALTKSQMTENKLVLIVKSRLKVFYRPKNLDGSSADVPSQLSFSFHTMGTQTVIDVNNPSAYYASVAAAKLIVNGKEIDVKNAEMIAPKSIAKWSIDTVITPSEQPHLKAAIVNDYGATDEQEISLKQPQPLKQL